MSSFVDYVEPDVFKRYALVAILVGLITGIAFAYMEKL